MAKRKNSLIPRSGQDVTHEYPGFGILGRYPVTALLIFATLGVITGIALMQWSPTTEQGEEKKSIVIQWIGLLGDLFIRALKCVVLPLVFFSVTISIVDMMQLGKAGKIAWKTIGLYVMTTVIASIIGIISILMYRRLFHEEYIPPPGPAMITLGCNQEGALLTEAEDGSVFCTADYTNKSNTEFIIKDITSTFVTKKSGPVTLSLSDTIYQGIFHKIIPSNIVASFSSGNFASVIFFALVFGFALGKVSREQQQEETGGEDDEEATDGKNTENMTGVLLRVLSEINDVFIVFINWIIMCTPFAVWSLIAKALGKQNNAAEQFKNVGYLVAAIITGQIMHAIVLWFVIFYLWTRWNPFTYLRNIVPAQTMAFACSSSAATIPVTLQSVRNTGKVPEAILRFVVPLGATINMDGTALGYPVTCIWLAVLNGIKPTAASYVLLIIIATVGSIGTAPIPSAGLVLIITAYNTVFNTTGIPDGFGYVVAIDWFVDRLETALNVTGDAIVCGIISKTTDISEIENNKGLEEIEKDMDVEDDVNKVVS